MTRHHPEPPNRGQTGRRHRRGWRRKVWSCEPCSVWLERRTLLAFLSVPLSPGSPHAATIAPLAATYYSVSSNKGGKLTATLDVSGFAARLSLVDAEGRPLVQSDGPATGATDGLIDVNVPKGTDYLEVQSLSGGGTYQITATLIPTDPAFQTVPTHSTGSNPIAAGQFFGSSLPFDLVAPDGIHVGNGDGTFRRPLLDGRLAPSGWTVRAIAVGDFSQGNLPDIAFTETKASPDGIIAQLCVLQNEGGGKFQPSTTLALPGDRDPIAIQTIAFGNGIVDLAVADSATGHVRIFVGNGQGGFSPGPVLAGGVRPHGLVAGRFGDGYVDLIVADEGVQNTGQGQGLSVFRADRPNAFQFSYTIDAGAGPSAIVAGDFRGKGVLDLAVADSNSDQVTILLNNGDGTFQARQSYLVGSYPQALVAGSFTGKRTQDGKPVLDLATANTNSYDVSVLLGNGDGTFKPQLRFGAGTFPASLVTADFNGDGRRDLATGNRGSGDITILLGRGDGTFQDQLTNPVGNGPLGAVTRDLNHDGHTDIITANLYSNDISVLLGNGDGTFQAARFFPAGEGPTALAVADFNGDGRLDVAVVDGGDVNNNGNGQDVSILLGNGDGTFQAPIFYPAGATPSSIVAGDWTGSGVIDLAVANKDSNDVTVFLGDGHGGFRALRPISLGDQAGEPVAITAGDFGNGHLDLAVVNQSSNSVSILLNKGQGDFEAQTPIPLGVAGSSVHSTIVAGYFTGNRILDLAVATTSSDPDKPDTVSILLGKGNGKFDPPTSYPLGTSRSPWSIITGNFFGGGPLDLDLAVADSGSNSVSLLQNDGRGGFQVMPALELGSVINPNVVVTGDFTGNGRSDLAIASQSPNSVVIELNQGNGQFAQPGSVGLVPHNTPLVADLNGDGVADVTIVDGAGDILFRQGLPNQPGRFDPPVTVNPGRPSRDIAAVSTNRGTLLASVDANDNFVSLFAYRNGGFSLVGSLATGVEPAQIVSADLMADGEDDLVIRNAGDGTLTVFFSNGSGSDATGNALFPRSVTLPVGLGVSDVTLADVDRDHDHTTDIVVTNKVSGEVGVLRNLGHGAFASAVLYRAGGGLYGVTNTGGSASLTTLEATVGVAAGAFTRGGPPDLVTINPGSNTFSLLAGLGAGRFANSVALQTKNPVQVVRVADFNHDGIPDLALLGSKGLSILLGNGHGGFSPPVTYDAGPDPTGLTVADVDNDGKLDLLVGNPFGDVLVLRGNGDGTFQPYRKTDQFVALAVVDLGNGTKGFIYANQGLDRVVVDYGGGQKKVLDNRFTGLLSPGAVKLADLDGDGIPDLIVANSGSNNVLIYPGLVNGQFGPALNGGHGFFTGTNPVGITVADVNGDGRPDLVIANKGSNDVSILLNQKQGNSLTFIPGPRLEVGSGPVSTVVQDVNGDGKPDILVSNSLSNNVMLLPGVGGGFFNDQNPTIFSVGNQPGPLFVGNFDGKLDLLTVNSGANDLTLISDFMGSHPVTTTISSGGLDPVAAFEFSSGSGFDNLVVANNGDGTFALLEGGPDGLNLTSTETEPGLLNPTDLAFLAFTGGQVQFYAATEGSEAATLLTFQLGGETGMPTVPGLQPLRDAALPLIATLLTLTIETSTAEFDPGAFDGEAAAAVSFLPVTAGQSLLELASYGDGEGGDEQEPNEPKEPDLPVTQESSSWQPFLMGLDEALDQFCRDSLDQFMSRDEPAPDKAQVPHALSKPLNLWQRDQASPEARGTIGTDSNHLPQANQGQIIDEAICSLWADESRPVRTSLTPTSVPLTSDGTTPAETAPANATLLSTEPVQRQDGPLLSSYERGFEALTECAVSLLLAAFVARRIDPPSTRHCTPTNPFSSLRLLRRPLSRFR